MEERRGFILDAGRRGEVLIPLFFILLVALSLGCTFLFTWHWIIGIVWFMIWIPIIWLVGKAAFRRFLAGYSFEEDSVSLVAGKITRTFSRDELICVSKTYLFRRTRLGVEENPFFLLWKADETEPPCLSEAYPAVTNLNVILIPYSVNVRKLLKETLGADEYIYPDRCMVTGGRMVSVCKYPNEDHHVSDKDLWKTKV